jgi:polyisoprenoid-binding protein YceI
MKKILFLFLLSAFVYRVNAQTVVHQTKSGKIKFFSSTPVEDIEAINNQVDAKLATNGQMVFQVAIRGFKFDNALMEEHFNENYLESAKYPKAVFMGTIANIKEVNFSKDGTYKVTVTGKIKLHGAEKEITASGTIEVNAGKVHSKSIFKLVLSDYGIKGNYIGDKIAKTVEVTVDCKYN